MMGRGKLILICQFGGNIVNHKDGSLSYTGGDAHAVYIFNDTLFSDLKLKLAQICNIDHNSITIKYFLPGNKQALFDLTDDHDLKNMLVRHSCQVTADIFVFGNQGFDQDAHLKSDICRDTRIKLAQTVEHDPLVSVVIDARTSSFDTDVQDTPSYLGFGTQLLTDPSFTRAKCSIKRKRPNEAEQVGIDSHDITFVADDTVSTKRAKQGPDDNVENNQQLIVGKKDENDIQKLTLWKEGIDGPGQEFDTADQFRDTLQKYAIANRFTYRFKKNDDNRVNGRCASEGCPWKIYAAWEQQTRSFRIKKMNKLHTCGGESWKNTYYVKNWLVDTVKKRLQSDPCYKLEDVADDIARDFGMELNFDQVRRWIKDAKIPCVVGQEEGHNRLLLFCDKLKMNPDVVVIPSEGSDGHFQQLFVSFFTVINGFREGCRPILFLDSTSLRSRKKESLLVASAIDGSDEFFPVAFGVVDGESDDSWIWFLKQLKSEVSLSGRTITFVSDHDTCLHEVVTRVFDNAQQGYSMYHLIESFRKKSTGSDSSVNSLMDAAITNNVNVFNNSMNHIKEVSPRVYDWLCEINPKYWANLQFKGERYNHITGDPIKAVNELLEIARRRPVKNKVGALLQMMANLVNTRRTESIEWNTKLTPLKEEWLEKKIMEASYLQVVSSSDSIFEVRDGTVNIVDLETRECSCSGWGPRSMPCVHAIAVCKHTGRSVYGFCPEYFTAERFRVTFSRSVNLVLPKLGDEGKNVEDGETEVPHVSSPLVPHDEPRTVKKVGKAAYRCTKCKKTGHNKTTCDAEE